jgi:uncharacterized protein YcfJ
MKNALLSTIALASLAGLGTAASAQGTPQEVGRVISTTPVIQQVGVPRQVCNTAQVATPSGPSGAGAVMGAIAGGALGNGVGQGSGRAAATALGILGGAILGNNIEGNRGTQVENVQQCTTQTFYENRTVAYNVVYEYGGRQYTVQMPNDPGPYVRLQVTPVGGTVPPMAPTSQVEPAYAPPAVQQTTTYVQTAPVYAAPVYTTPVYAAPIYAAPVYRPYYPPLGVSLNFGYVRHSGGGYHRPYWR